MKRKVIFEGELGEKFGHETYIEASSFGDVIRCFNANFNNFNEYLLECDRKQIEFICKVNNVALDEKELFLNYGEGDMIITPVPAGGIKKFIKSIVGAILVVVGLLVPGAQFLVKPGMSMIFSGIVDLLAPDPAADARDAEPDYIYQGTAQIIREGDPIPVLYGRMRIPGKPISFDIRASNAIISKNAACTDNMLGAKGGTSRQANAAKFTATIASVTEMSL
tara:strand:- start:5899 stop:6564 length:666 start_codon:yes stop_codon:yes gene_type:complete